MGVKADGVGGLPAEGGDQGMQTAGDQRATQGMKTAGDRRTTKASGMGFWARVWALVTGRVGRC